MYKFFNSFFVIWFFQQNLFNSMLIIIKIILKNEFSKKSVFFVLKKPPKFGYIWIFKKRFFKIKPVIINNNFFLKTKFKKFKLTNKIVKIKKLSGLFKRRLNFRTTLLKRRSFLFKRFNKNFKKIFHYKFRKKKNPYKVYNINFFENRKNMFFENRKIIRFFLKKKHIKKQNKLNSFLVNFIKKNSKNLINYYEFKINVILVKSHIFNNTVDSCFWVNKGLVSVNNNIIYNSDTIIQINDLIKIVNKNHYYFFYKNSLNNSIRSLKKLNWAFYKFKKKKRLNKFFPKVYSWISCNIHFGFDVPYFFEIDYLNLTVFVFMKPLTLVNTNYNNIKYINFYLTRLYNWNYIT